ncbi:MAG: transketolase C-terminal domain-containing protein, partial [Ignavibacteriaceae bacterium]
EYAIEIIDRGKKQNAEWDETFLKYQNEYPELAAQLKLIQKREMPEGWDCCIPTFKYGDNLSGRKANGKVLNAIAEKIPFMIGGSADLSPSTLTTITGTENFEKESYNGRNLHFGIREHAMGAIVNGVSLSGLKSFASTFLVFSDYARSSIRLSALMNQPVIYIFTHDSIGVGEDGPTHQPIEHIASLRAIPNLEVIRPADANEVAVLWKHIMELKDRPTALILSRQYLPVFDRNKYASAQGALKGGYILADCEGAPDVILISTGSEVSMCIEAYEELMKDGINTRVVSMPCWSLYERQSPEYWKSVLPSNITARVAVEAGSTFGWRRFVGLHNQGEVLGMRTFGASGKLSSLLEEFGLTTDSIVKSAKEVIRKNKNI